MHLTATGNALFTKTQQRVLGLLFNAPDRRFYTNEIVRLAAMGRGTVGRELERLVAIGLLNSTREGKQRYYQANPACPVYPEVLGIIRKTSGIDNLIEAAIAPLREKIRVAFVYGAIARGEESVDSPVDLFIIADRLAYGDAMLSLTEASRLAGRIISPSIYSPAQLVRELGKRSTFVRRVFQQPKLWVIGDETLLDPWRS